jgi:hypothetical protein
MRSFTKNVKLCFFLEMSFFKKLRFRHFKNWTKLIENKQFVTESSSVRLGITFTWKINKKPFIVLAFKNQFLLQRGASHLPHSIFVTCVSVCFNTEETIYLLLSIGHLAQIVIGRCFKLANGLPIMYFVRFKYQHTINYLVLWIP